MKLKDDDDGSVVCCSLPADACKLRDLDCAKLAIGLAEAEREIAALQGRTEGSLEGWSSTCHEHTGRRRWTRDLHPGTDADRWLRVDVVDGIVITFGGYCDAAQCVWSQYPNTPMTPRAAMRAAEARAVERGWLQP